MAASGPVRGARADHLVGADMRPLTKSSLTGSWYGTGRHQKQAGLCTDTPALMYTTSG
jgi:hypothetical protein